MDEYEAEESFVMQLRAARVSKLAEWVQELPAVPENVATMEMLVNYDDAGHVKISVSVRCDQPAPEPEPVTVTPTAQPHGVLMAIVLISALIGWLAGRL